MRELDIAVTDWTEPPHIVARVEAALHRRGLRLTMKGTLKTCPGSTHWHYKLGREPGTLELTLWPAKQRLWISVQAGRTAPWIEEVLPALQHELACAMVQPRAHRSLRDEDG